jgi:ectoine hydroxylase-related dioxygenase (phytanoyl-CoA dioxygenase family)
MESEIRHHGVREFHRNESAEDLSVEEIKSIGYTIIESGFDAEELQLIRGKIDRIYEQQLREIEGRERLARINDADVARCLIGYDEYFVRLAAHPQIISLATRLLGEYFILMSQNGIINRSAEAHYQVTWHRDLNYQHFVSSRPLALSALYCIDDFSEETGGTYLIPASHKVEAFPSPDYVKRQQKGVEAKAGSILVFDAMLYHRSGENRSGRVRRSVNHIFTLPLIKQQISLPKVLRGKFSDDPFLRKFLGYETESGESVHQWRTSKLKMTEAEPLQ